jgi:hypothetical protein
VGSVLRSPSNTRQHPDLADEIRELFPALVVMEDLGSVVGQPTLSRPGPIPELLGDFRILREVGRGGMGVVYEAVQESLGRHVALKMLPYPGLLDATQLERFRREENVRAQSSGPFAERRRGGEPADGQIPSNGSGRRGETSQRSWLGKQPTTIVCRAVRQ